MSLFASHPIHHFLFLSRLSSPRIRPFSTQLSAFLPGLAMEETGKTVHSVWSPWYFSRFSPFRRSSITSVPAGRKLKKETRPSIHPSARLSVRLYPRNRDIRIVAIMLLDIHSISKEVRGAVAKIAFYATIRQTEGFRSDVFSRFRESSLELSNVTTKHDDGDD